jgi:carboxyl-terminal processing protease
MIGLVACAPFGEQALGAKAEPADAALPLAELRTLAEVFGKIKTDYVESVRDKKLLEDAIQGMLSGLDPHSAYLDPEAFKEVRIGTEGQFGGLGIEVTMENGLVKVVTPIDDTPAHRAGVQPGDLIIKLDDTAVKGLTLNEAVRKMRGEPNTTIRLTISREGVPKPIELTLTRAIIRITSVKSRTLEPGYGYLRITQFQSETTDAVRRQLGALKEASGGSLRGLVLDLRNNPGGILNSAVSVSDVFLADGIIVTTRGRISDSQLAFSATPDDALDGAPMVVLVNEGSASASEIVAGALQDHKRAIIMGTKTFGKGSVQTILPMDNGAALKITTARYYTPKDRSIQAEGIVPDVLVENLKLAKGDGDAPARTREADLARHLSNGKEKEKPEKPADKDKGARTPPAAPAQEVATVSPDDDFQLREALTLLKGMNVLRSRG